LLRGGASDRSADSRGRPRRAPRRDLTHSSNGRLCRFSSPPRAPKQPQ
jgi:hypothetical protein